MLVRAAGERVAVDLGLGALHGLLRAGVAHRDLDAVLLTHLHPDHVADLPSLLFAANYDEVPRERSLLLAGGEGLRGFVARLAAAFGPWLEPKGYALEVRELRAGENLRLGELLCRPGAVHHIPSSLAYRFDSGGRSAVVSGDTGPSPELEALARGADLLVLEASLPPGAELKLHLAARQAGELARAAGVGRLVLTHLYPAADAAGPGALASEAFGGEVVVAADGLTLEA